MAGFESYSYPCFYCSSNFCYVQPSSSFLCQGTLMEVCEVQIEAAGSCKAMLLLRGIVAILLLSRLFGRIRNALRRPLCIGPRLGSFGKASLIHLVF